MKDNNKVCGMCKWHVREDADAGWACDNLDSDNYADWTDYGDTCEEWEGRE